MSTLIVYMTKHGCTERTAGMLKEHLYGEVTLVNLKKEKKPDLSRHETIVIGGSIRAGRIQEGVRKFCERNRETLLGKRLGLYLCCMYDGETADKQFEEAYPEELRRHAAAAGLFGGEFDFQKMNFIERKIVKKVARVEESVSRIDSEAIRNFAVKISQGSGWSSNPGVLDS